MTHDQARTEGYLEIPGINWPGTDVPDPMPFDEAEWFSWYNRVLVHRILVSQACSQPGESGVQARQANEALCRQPGGIGHIYWLATFCSILEPRDDDTAVRPFIPYPRQVELILTIHETMNTPHPHPLASLAVEKAREVGATWIDASDHAWRWSFDDFYTGAMVARVEEDVDKPDEPSSWMWKLDFILGRHMRLSGNTYPGWLLPQGFRWSKHRRFLSLTNPATSSYIRGLATHKNTGRQMRMKKLSVDEAGFNEYFGDIWNLNAFTTHHRFCYSSAGVDPPDFYYLVHGKEGYKKPRVFRFEYHQVPGRGREWLELKRQEMEEDAFQREVLIKYLAGTGVLVYPEAEYITIGHFPYEPGLGPVYVSIDDGHDDDTGIVGFQRESGTSWVRIIFSYRNHSKIIHFYGSLLNGEPENRFSRDYTRHDFEFMRWTKKIGLSKLASFVGDRHGDYNNQVTGTNPFQVLHEEYGIYVHTAITPQENDLYNRKLETKQLIPWLKVHNGMNAADVAEALQGHRYPKRRSASQPTGENAKPMHDNTHLVTPVEYFAMQYPVSKAGRRMEAQDLPRNEKAFDAMRSEGPPTGRFKDRRVIQQRARMQGWLP